MRTLLALAPLFSVLWSTPALARPVHPSPQPELVGLPGTTPVLGETPSRTPLHVYRSRRELPRALARQLPVGFDFGRHILAGFPGGDGTLVIIVSVPARRERGASVLSPPPGPCPPCQGGAPSMDESRMERDAMTPQVALFRVPRAPGPVLLEQVAAVCQVCPPRP